MVSSDKDRSAMRQWRWKNVCSCFEVVVVQRYLVRPLPLHYIIIFSHPISFLSITVTTQSFFGLGSGGLQIKINLTGTPETHPNDIFYLRHRPSWKVRKNVFTALKSRHPGGASPTPTLSPTGADSSTAGQRIMVYSCFHDTEGEVKLSMAHGKKLDHMGIQVKFFGRIDLVRTSCLHTQVMCSIHCFTYH